MPPGFIPDVMTFIFCYRHVREFVGWLVSEDMLIYYIHNFRDSFWPGGKLAPPYPIRTDLVRFATMVLENKLL